jgi:hypothetical protein
MKTHKINNIKIQHDKFGVILNETFVDNGQFTLFLKMIQGCVELKNDLTFCNGLDFLIHVPIDHLIKSIIVTSHIENYELADHMKSKIESLNSK